MSIKILQGDCRDVLPTLPSDSVHCVVTSPPYWGLRDYGTAKWEGGDAECDHAKSQLRKGFISNSVEHRDIGFIPFSEICGKCGARHIDSQLGLEASPEAYIAAMVAVLREVRRVLRKDGTLWLNMGDCYAAAANGRSAADTKAAGNDDRTFRDKPFSTVGNGLKPKDLVGMPWRLAFALQADGWWLRQDIIWAKPNPMPESVTDRCTKAHEYIFLLSKAQRYYYDAAAIREGDDIYTRKAGGYYGRDGQNASRFAGNGGFGDSDVTTIGRNKRSVWEIATAPFAEAHFATFPPALIEPCILAGTSEKGCCAKCGAPWVRETEIERRPTRPGLQQKGAPDRNDGGIPFRPETMVTTLGWSPSCSCNAEAVSCVIIDPFGGAGTTGLVADRLGRDAILIELNPNYADMAERRIVDDGPLFAQVEMSL